MYGATCVKHFQYNLYFLNISYKYEAFTFSVIISEVLFSSWVLVVLSVFI